MNTMQFWDAKKKRRVIVKACQSKAGIWRHSNRSPAAIKRWAAKAGLVHVTSKTKLSEILE